MWLIVVLTSPWPIYQSSWKTESECNPHPRSFLVKSLEGFVGDLPEERLLCPVRAVRIYLALTSTLSPCPRSLLLSHRRPSRVLSKNSLSHFLCQVILDAGAVDDGALLPRTHSVCAVAASAAFLRNWSVSKVLEAATWRSNPVFTLFCFRNLSYTLDSSLSLALCCGGLCFNLVLHCVFAFLVLPCLWPFSFYVGIACYPYWYVRVCRLPGIGLCLGLDI